jgi:hypothetical protein
MRIRVEFEALAPRPWMVGASVPALSALPKPPWPAAPRPTTEGTDLSTC